MYYYIQAMNNMLQNMIIISILTGVLSSMNILAISPKHIRFHLNDTYMILLMTSWMILFVGIIYKNFTIVTISLIFVIVFIFSLRKQLLIDDREFIKGMIPHHSMAITMALQIRNKTKNKKIISLANDIINSQTREIKDMQEIEYNL
jgi:hypothetical protein